MKKNNVTKQGVILGIICLLITSCSSTKVLSSWSLSNPPAGIMDKTLVLAAVQGMAQKDALEQAMADELNKVGITAYTATNIFGPKRFSGLSQEQITAKLKGSDLTSVMIISLVDKEKYKNYVPGTFYAYPRIVGYSRYYRRYLVIYDEMYTPGYFTTGTDYVLEADIYTVNDDDQLIYSAQTQSYDPVNAKALGQSFARTIVDELRARAIIR